MIEFKKGVARQAIPLLMVLLIVLLGSTALWAASNIQDLRFGDNKGYIRMVMEFDRPLNPAPSVSIDGNTLQVTLTGIINNLSGPRIGTENRDIIGLDVSRKSDVMRIDAAFSFAPSDVRTFSLDGPHRFIIDAYRPLSPADTRPAVEKARGTDSMEETVTHTEPVSESPHSPPATALAVNDASSADAQGSAAPQSGRADDLRRHRFQQRLIAALIVVTSIVAVLLFLLIRMDHRRKNPSAPSWKHDLPPISGRHIESIDSEIGEHLKNHDQR